MRNFLRRIRGILGLGSVGAVGGALFGAAWGLVELIAPGIARIPLLYHVVGWSVVGAATAAGFGLLLATTSGRRRLEDMGPWRARALGAVAGAVSPILVQTAFAGTLPTLTVSLLTGAIGAALGAAVGFGAYRRRSVRGIERPAEFTPGTRRAALRIGARGRRELTGSRGTPPPSSPRHEHRLGVPVSRVRPPLIRATSTACPAPSAR